MAKLHVFVCPKCSKEIAVFSPTARVECCGKVAKKK